MGVIKKPIDHSSLEIKASVSQETLYIPSSDDERFSQHEDEQTRHHHLRILRHHVPTVGSSFPSLKTHSGKKKSRRYQNVTQLVTLAEEDELQEVTIEDFVENSRSPFTVLLEDDKCLEKWNEFVNSTEEKQQEMIAEAKAKRRNELSKAPLNRRLNVALRNLLRKKNLPIGMLQYLEQEVVSFFSAMPTQTYISPALSSFERLLLHSVSDYHQLMSLSFDSQPERVRLVRVQNPKKEFQSPELLLVQYLEAVYHVN